MDEQNVLVVGRFSAGLTKADIETRLAWAGHGVVRSLAQATVLLAGTGAAAERQVEAALASGLRVVRQAELDALAPALSDAPAGERAPTLSWEAQLSWVMARPYDERSWGLLTQVLKPLSPSVLAQAVASVEEEVWTWPAHARYGDNAWLQALLTLEEKEGGGTPDPRLRLVGNLMLSELLKGPSLDDARRVLSLRQTHLPGVRQLRISHMSGGSGWLEVLEPSLLAGLTEFDFMYNGFGTAGLERVLAALPCAEVTVLDLRSNHLGTAGAKMLAGAGLHRLRWLNLYQNDIRDAGLAALCGPKALPALEYLSVAYNGLSAKSGQKLAKAPFARQLTTLKVKYNSLLAEGAAALAQGPFTALKRLDISANEIGDAGLEALVASPALERLVRLDIEGNHHNPLITDAGMTCLATQPGLPQLQELWVAMNQISGAGLEALLTSPHRRALAVLGIENNRICGDQIDVWMRDDLPVSLERLRINFQSGPAAPFCRALREARALVGLQGLWISPPWDLRGDLRVTAALLDSPFLRGLDSLELWEVKMDTPTVKRLIQTPFSDLRKLTFYSAGMTNPHYRLLTSAPWLSGLEELVISDGQKLEDVSPLKAHFAGTLTSFVAF